MTEATPRTHLSPPLLLLPTSPPPSFLIEAPFPPIARPSESRIAHCFLLLLSELNLRTTAALPHQMGTFKRKGLLTFVAKIWGGRDTGTPGRMWDLPFPVKKISSFSSIDRLRFLLLFPSFLSFRVVASSLLSFFLSSVQVHRERVYDSFARSS